MLLEAQDLFENPFFLALHFLEIFNGLPVVFNTGIDRHRDCLGPSEQRCLVARVESEDFIRSRQGICIILLFQEASHYILESSDLVLSDLLILLFIGALPLDLCQLSVIYALSVPLGIVTEEVAPATVSLLVLTAGRAHISSVVLFISSFHDQLERKEARVVRLLSHCFQLGRVVYTGF